MSGDRLRSVRRRYYLLVALRFVPTGLMVPVLVLLLQQRGLSLREIGIGMAAQGAVMLLLELPTGGLADAFGRRPVVIAATAVSMGSTALLLVADSVALLALVFALQGIFRALDSGPLQSWFVDSLLEEDAGADLERGLGRSEAVVCLSMGAGSLLAGVVVGAGGWFGLDPLVTPLVLALGIQAVALAATSAFMKELRPARGVDAVVHALAAVPAAVRTGVRTIRASHVLMALVAAEALWGAGMIAFETLLPPRLAEVSDGADQAATILGPAVTAAWVLSALGSAVAPALAGRIGAPRAGLALRLAHGAAVVAMGVAAGPMGVVVAYLGTYWVHGATNTVHYGMVHRAVDSSHRATVISANSLASQAGGAASGIALGALADATSITTAMLVAALLLAAAGPLYLVGRTSSSNRSSRVTDGWTARSSIPTEVEQSSRATR